MRCDEIRGRLQEYVTGEVADPERQAIEQHLASCPECRREAGLMELLIVSVESDTVIEPPPGFVESVMEDLPSRVRLSRPGVFQYLSAAVLGSGVLLGYLFWDVLTSWTGGLGNSFSYAASRLNPAPVFETLLSTRIELFYLAAMSFASLLVAAGVIWFTRYYRKPLHYH